MLALQPVRSEIPIYLAALGPKNLDLTGEIADGWLAHLLRPGDRGRLHHPDPATPPPAAGRDPADIDICATVPVSVADDPAAWPPNRVRGHAALYIGGMGSAKTNFYHRTATEMGFGEQADEVQDRFLARDYAGAARRRAVRVHRPDQPARRRATGSPSGWTGSPTGESPRVAVSCFDRRPGSKIATLTTVIAGSRSRPGRRGMTLLQAIILGIVEGLTEFLPVSSTGHLTIVAGLLGLQIDDPSITAFIAVIQVGAIMAVLIFYLARTSAGCWSGLVPRPVQRRAPRPTPSYRMAWLVIIGSLPIVIVGFLGRDLIKGPLRSLWVVAIALIVWGVVMLLAEAIAKQNRGETDLNLKDALIIGVRPGLALIPGVSRSGATISVGLMRGLDRVTADPVRLPAGDPGAGRRRGATSCRPPSRTAGSAGCPTLVGTVVSASSSPTRRSPGCSVRRRAHHPGLRLVPVRPGRGLDPAADHRLRHRHRGARRDQRRSRTRRRTSRGRRSSRWCWSGTAAPPSNVAGMLAGRTPGVELDDHGREQAAQPGPAGSRTSASTG